MINFQIGDAIAHARRDRKIPQGTFAQQIGVTQPYLSQIERNIQHPSNKMLRNICRQLNIKLSDLLFEVLASTRPQKEQNAFKRAQPLFDKMLETLIPKK